MRCGTALTLALAGVALTRTMGRRLSPTASTAVFAGNGIHSRPPLAVLRAATPDGRGASLTLELKVFPEDPKWASQVDKFMIATGADARGVEGALNRVRHVSWAAGRTFRGKHVVLLAFAEDMQSDGDDKGSSRLTRAVLAASRHTNDAHLVLVADGFELDGVTREIVESVLDNEGWRSFTAIEVPEFEGFSSAVNRAMEIIPGNSVVAVLSTSSHLLPASTADASAPAPPMPMTDEAAESTINGTGSRESARDVFVAFEQMRSSVSAHGSWSLWGGNTLKFGPLEDGIQRNTGREEARYDQYGHIHHPNNTDNGNEGLLVTVLPSKVTTDRKYPRQSHQGRGGRGRSEEEGNGQNRHKEAEDAGRFEAGRSSGKRLSDAAPFPLLVFDTETFLALGELDERFAFQGGVAEWICRATLGSIDQGGAIGAEVGGSCGCDASSRRCRRSPGRKRSEMSRGVPAAPSCSKGIVRHVHAREWGERFTGSWPDESVRPSRGSSAETRQPSARLVGANWLISDGDQQHEVGNQVFRPGEQPIDYGISRPNEEAVVDQWTRLPPARLEALVQADADLFFLPLLLLQDSSEADSAKQCITFHAEWMERAPDKTLERDALLRRERFPVAVVVVVHDDISLMRAALDEVVAVVEFVLVVVSLTPWHGDAKDMAPTLDLLDEMVADVDSPTHGKLKIEVGSWVTEAEQREHGNALIREDARNFFRVVVMDTDEFWHPVELAKTLVLAMQRPEAAYARVEMDTYWASVRSVVSPPEMLLVLWLVDPRRCFWFDYRAVKCKVPKGREHRNSFDVGRSLGVMHHLSYVRVEKDLRRKMVTFSHAGDEESGWYTRSWLGWAANNSLTDLHPVEPEVYKRVAIQPLLRLTPALRALHLDAKKGRDSALLAVEMPIGRRSSPSPGSTAGSAHNEEDRAAVYRDSCRPEDGAAHGDYHGPVHSCADCCLRGQGSDSRCETNHCAGGVAGGRHRGERPGGCESVPEEAQWTERQRTMCLIPDVGGRTAAQ